MIYGFFETDTCFYHLLLKKDYVLNSDYNCFFFVNMGIKAIKAVENKLTPNPIFDLQSMIKIRKEPVANFYNFIKKVGSGTYGEVFIAQHEQTKHRRAIKRINTLKFGKARAMILNQISLLKGLVNFSVTQDHPNILKIYEIFQQAEHIFIVT